MARRVILLSLALALAAAASPAAAQNRAHAGEAIADQRLDELLLFAVQLDNTTLTEALTAYGDPADPLIPIGELARLLDLDLQVRPGEAIASGRLGESQRPITIDLAAGIALVGGRTIDLVPPDSIVTATDIYLRASLVEKLLPLRIASAPDDLALALTATETLPLQSRRLREGRLAGLAAQGPGEIAGSVLEVASPYQWLGRPAFDFSAELGGDSALGQPLTRFEARVAGDVLKTGLSGWIATDERARPSAARVTLTRRSPRGDLLGPLHGTLLAAGDTYAPALPLGPRSTAGAGLVFSSARIEEATVFQRINLRGELPLGYDAELYVNDVLRAGQQGVASQGRYDFTDVPLVRGRNVIRIVLYGPRGERSEQTRVIEVGGGQLAAGAFSLDAGIVAQDRELIDLSGDDELPGDKGKGDLRAVISAAYGVTSGLTVTAGFARFADRSGTAHNVLDAGLRTSLLGLAVQADTAADLDGGHAMSLGLAGRIAGIGFLGRHVEYGGGFADEANSAWDLARPMRRYSEVTFDLAVPLAGTASLPLSGRVERAEYADGGITFAARARTTTNLAGTLVALGGDFVHRTGPGLDEQQLTGNLSAMRFVAYKWQLRATADFRLLPQWKLETLGLSADRAIGERYSLRLGASRSFASRDVSLEAGLTARLPFADLTLGGDYTTGERRWRFGLQLNFGLAYDPQREGYRMTPPGPASGGSAALLAFVDDNANGLPDAGEQPVPGVMIHGASAPVVTDEHGRAFFTGLGAGPTASLRADIGNTDTGFVTPPPADIVVHPRAGQLTTILYPLVPTSELWARIVFRQSDGLAVPLSAVRLRLVGANGSALEGVTEYDGGAVFDAVRPGHYRLELEAEQAARLGMRLASPVTVVIGKDGAAAEITGEVLIERRSST